MSRFDVEFTDEIISNHAGLVLVGNVLASDGFKQVVDSIKDDAEKDYPDYDILKSYLGLLSLGKSAYEDIDDYRSDIFFKQALEIEVVPSKETLRQRLEDLSNEKVNLAIEGFNVQLIRQYSIL